MAVVDDKGRPVPERPAPVQRVAEPYRPRQAPAEPLSKRDDARLPRRGLMLIGAAMLLAIAAIGGVTAWWLKTSKWVTTDDAFIDVHMVQVSPQVAGRVARVLVNDNQEVRAGQPLVDIDPADFQAKLDQALANQQSAQGQLVQAQAQLPLTQANLDEARAQVGVAQATATNADVNLKRDQDLARMGSLALSRQQLDNDTTTARSDAANLAAAQQKVAASEAQL